MKKIWLILYLGFARWLPATDNALPFSKYIRRFRSYIGGKCLDFAGQNVNIEQYSNFGMGGYFNRQQFGPRHQMPRSWTADDRQRCDDGTGCCDSLGWSCV